MSKALLRKEHELTTKVLSERWGSRYWYSPFSWRPSAASKARSRPTNRGLGSASLPSLCNTWHI